MRSLILRVRWAFALLALSALVVPGATAAEKHPLKATIAIAEQVVGSAPGCELVGLISGTGQIAHLGKVNVTAQDCINNVEGGTYSFFASNVVITAANGDRMHASYMGTLTFEGTIGTISGAYLISGGTGRFANATGTGSVQGVEELNPATGAARGQIQLNGTISY